MAGAKAAAVARREAKTAADFILVVGLIGNTIDRQRIKCDNCKKRFLLAWLRRVKM